MTHDDPLVIGLLNNMPDTALRATERQFTALLDAAAAGMAVQLSIYTLPDVPRAAWGQGHVDAHYSSLDDLFDSRVDGLIVTGTEPKAANLMEEPYWGSLTRVLEWAQQHTRSTVWSCLAAHAAALQMDGICRRPFGDKLFGVFEGECVSEHRLVSGAPSTLRMPHSRWNDLPLEDLQACGYEVLTRFRDGGADSFVKQADSLFVFFQGHPEYDTDALLLEYRRDIGRFLRRERETYPSAPQGYFDDATSEELMRLRERLLSDRREELLSDFDADEVAKRIANTWQHDSVGLYRNWLLFLRDQRSRALAIEATPIGPVRPSERAF